MRNLNMALRATKSFSLEKEVLKWVEKSKGPASTSERVNELLKMGLLMEQRRKLDQESADFFQSDTDKRTRKAFQSASAKSFSRED
jgi:hypothetical protein